MANYVTTLIQECVEWLKTHSTCEGCPHDILESQPCMARTDPWARAELNGTDLPESVKRKPPVVAPKRTCIYCGGSYIPTSSRQRLCHTCLGKRDKKTFDRAYKLRMKAWKEITHERPLIGPDSDAYLYRLSSEVVAVVEDMGGWKAVYWLFEDKEEKEVYEALVGPSMRVIDMRGPVKRKGISRKWNG